MPCLWSLPFWAGPMADQSFQKFSCTQPPAGPSHPTPWHPHQPQQFQVKISKKHKKIFSGRVSGFLFSGKFKAAPSPGWQAHCPTRPQESSRSRALCWSIPIHSSGARGGGCGTASLGLSLLSPATSSGKPSNGAPTPPGMESPRCTSPSVGPLYCACPSPRSWVHIRVRPAPLSPPQWLLPHLPSGTNTSWPRAGVQA